MLSLGAPAGFKGFANAVAPTTFNSAWTARTGSRTTPPAAALPPYIAVVVSSHVTQSGAVVATICG